MGDLSLPINPVDLSTAMPLAAGSADLAKSLDGLKNSIDVKKAEKVAKDFESVLLHKLMESMQRTIPESGLLDSGITKQVQGIFWFYLAQEMADAGGVGLWRDIYSQMTDHATQAVEQSE